MGGEDKEGRGPRLCVPKMDPNTAHIQSKARGQLDKGGRSYFQGHHLGEGGEALLLWTLLPRLSWPRWEGEDREEEA